MRALLGLALAALAPPVAARLLAEEAEDETEEEVRHYAIAIGVGLLGVTFVVEPGLSRNRGPPSCARYGMFSVWSDPYPLLKKYRQSLVSVLFVLTLCIIKVTH